MDRQATHHNPAAATQVGTNTVHERPAARWALLLAAFFMLALAALMAQPAQAKDTVTLYITNAQGSVVATMTPQGQITYTAAYRPYGRATGDTTLQSGPGYTGHVTDTVSGLTYMQQRYYDPDIGRFISPDPVAPAAGNIFNFGRYTYANDNPVRFTDLTGMCPKCFVRATPYNFYRDNPVGRIIGDTAGNLAAVFTKHHINPLTHQHVTPKDRQQAKMNALVMLVPAAKAEKSVSTAVDALKPVVSKAARALVDKVADSAVGEKVVAAAKKVASGVRGRAGQMLKDGCTVLALCHDPKSTHEIIEVDKKMAQMKQAAEQAEARERYRRLLSPHNDVK